MNIAGKHKPTARLGLAPIRQHLKAGMRLSIPIQLQPMAIKTPGQPWVVFESTRMGHISELQAVGTQTGISIPEAFSAAKIRQT